jgi:hypothetical protein
LLTAGLLVPATPAAAAEADTLFTLANQDRAANGLPALRRNSAMDQVAANWAAHMGQTGTLAHNPSYSSQIPGGWSRAGENVAKGYPTATAMHAGWMASSGHRANILGDFTDVGVAFITAGGTTWGVEVFARYASAAPPPPPPPAPAPAPAPAPPPPAAAPAAPSAAAPSAAAPSAAAPAAPRAAEPAPTATSAAAPPVDPAPSASPIPEPRSIALAPPGGANGHPAAAATLTGVSNWPAGALIAGAVLLLAAGAGVGIVLRRRALLKP